MFKTNRFLSRSIFLSAFVSLVLFSLAALLFPVQPVRGAPNITYTVNSSGDEPDDELADYVCLTAGGLCTLRAAIEQANYMLTTHNEILFSSFMIITPDTELPALTNPDGVTIYSDDHVYLLGTDLSDGDGDGLTLASANNEIMGLVIVGFDNGIVVNGNNNLIGTDGDGVDDATERNVIYSNKCTLCTGYGIHLAGSNNVVAGNYIGVDTNGSGAQPNTVGIFVTGNNNRIGTAGSTAYVAERNVISGNDEHGIDIEGDNTVVAGNYIGLKANGTEAQPNGSSGIAVDVLAANTRIGTNSDGSYDSYERNFISGNASNGITNQGDYTLVMENYIGTDPTGLQAIPNGGYGVVVTYSSYEVFIGTNGDGTRDTIEGNLISGNTQGGVAVTSTNQKTTIAGNRIGTNYDGSAALANGGDGIYAEGAGTGLVIGTDGDGTGDFEERNRISGNSQNGIRLNSGFSGAVIAGNYIGTNPTGMSAIPNASNGILLTGGAHNNRIGNNDPSERNLISGNTLAGVRIEGVGSDHNKVYGNYIGTNFAGNAPLGNKKNGIEVDDQAAFTIIGDPGVAGNLISGNTASGISIGTDCESTFVWGNIIGLNAAKTSALGNGSHGIYLKEGAFDSDIQANVISANVAAGIFMADTAGSGNAMDGSFGSNYISDNGGLGIDLAPWGVNPNDPADADSGPNDLMNYPVFTKLETDGSVILAEGYLNSEPNQSFLLKLFMVKTCDPSGYGEGADGGGFIIQRDVTTNSSGIATFVISGDSYHAAYPYLVMATEYSEFSECKLIENTGSADPAHLSIADASLAEGDGGSAWMNFEVTLDHAATITVTASFDTTDGTALHDQDYVSASGTVSFPPGATQQTIRVAILGDTQAEPHETFRVSLMNPQGAEIQDGQATGTILDDDGGGGYYLYLPIVIR